MGLSRRLLSCNAPTKARLTNILGNAVGSFDVCVQVLSLQEIGRTLLLAGKAILDKQFNFSQFFISFVVN